MTTAAIEFPPVPVTPALRPKVRFTFIDGLRGIACLAVLLHHLYHNSELKEPLSTIFPHWLDVLATLGARGVQIFFVLSGFVIAYSIRNMKVTAASTSNFILRRQIRLDLAYWSILFLAFADGLLAWRVHPTLVEKPEFHQLIVNMFYLQNITHQPNFLSVAWTLCLEVQFYLLLILIAGTAQRLSKRNPLRIQSLLVFGIAIVSIIARSRVQTDGDIPWFYGSWYLFGMGSLCFWSINQRSSKLMLWIVVAGVLSVGIWKTDSGIIVGVMTVSAIYIAARVGGLTKWLQGNVIQYFGRISYSLYLVHLLILQRVYKAGIHLTGLARWPALGWFVVAAALSVLAAQAMYMTVERPTMRFAERLKRKPPLTPGDPSMKSLEGAATNGEMAT
jgi:peptidoglycan/LPS O-acetylase OafA/YrhL